MEWVSVKDRLPEKDGEYIVYGLVLVGTLGFNNGYWWTDLYRINVDQNKITHWMPLPEPPKDL